MDIEHHNAKKSDPEHFEYDCLTVEDVEKLLNESVECLSNIIKSAPSLAKTLLLEHKWCLNEIVTKYRENPSELLVYILLCSPLLPIAYILLCSISINFFSFIVGICPPKANYFNNRHINKKTKRYGNNS